MRSSLPVKSATALLLSATISLAGCVGQISGVVRGHGEKVNVLQNGNDLYVTILPDGESFEGKRIQMQTSHFSGVLIEAPAIRSPFGDVTYYYHFGPYRRALTYGGILSGNRGRTMWCNIFMTGFGGGEGLCDLSDGRTIDLQW